MPEPVIRLLELSFHTRMEVGSEAMTEARQVYGYVKAAVKTMPGLKPVAEQLAKRFKHASAKTPAPAAAK